MIFETDRTIVRLWRDVEADRLYDILRRDEVVQWFGGDMKPFEHVDEAAERIANWRKSHEEDPRYGSWAVELKGSGTVVGTVLLKPLPNGEGGEVEIGWYLHPDSWGQGLAQESARGGLAKGFADGLSEIWAITHTTNEPSKKVALAIGMADEGVFRDRWYDGPSQVFHISREEWAVASQA
ncbi:MAG TPA: GNAT family N-acetyltransferase [Nocardioidaceae bacterium]|nr:GNAT family N-acetyltransferase [Nocardioidaceae bacterium]